MKTRRITAAIAAAAGLTAAIATPATADPLDLFENNAEIIKANTGWWAENWGADWGFVIAEAELYAVGADPLTAATINDDALDGQFVVLVDEEAYGTPACPGEDCQYVVDITDVGGDTVVTAPMEVLSGLEVTVEHRYYAAGDLARALVTLRNPSAAPITVTTGAFSNLGSDSDTVVEADSSGDAVITAADRWFVTGDDGWGEDPIVTTAWWGTGATKTPVAAEHEADDETSVGFEITVAPGATERLAYFVALDGLDPDGGAFMVSGDVMATVAIAPDYATAVTAAVAGTSEFGSFSGRPAAGLPAGTRVLNWGTVAGAPVTPAAPAARPIITPPAFTG